MDFCPHCGAYIPLNETVCPACGFDSAAASQQQSGQSSWGGAAAAQQQQRPQQQNQQHYQQQNAEPRQEESHPAAWEPWKKTEEDAKTDPRRLSVLSYVGPLFLLPLFLHKNDPFVRFHANQGLVLFLLECLVFTILGRGLLGAAGLLFCVYCLVRGAKNVAEGKMARLPLIGGIQLLK